MGENLAKGIREIGPVGSAILEECTSGWSPLYRFRKGLKVTEWGQYDDVFTLDDQVYLSPYWEGSKEWMEVDAVTAIGIIAISEATGEH